jgi:hypothetical protein
VGIGHEIGFDSRRRLDWPKYPGAFEFVGEGSWKLAAEVGVGGYECTLDVELEALALSCRVIWESIAEGMRGAEDTFVRVLNDNAASV